MTDPTPLEYQMNPDVEGLAGRRVIADPTGNNQPTEEITAKDSAGNVVGTGMCIQRHGGGDMRFVRINAQGAAGVVELDGAGRPVTVDA